MRTSRTGRLTVAMAVGLIGAGLVVTAIGGAQGGGSDSIATAKLRNPDGRTVGQVTLREGRRGIVEVSGSARGLAPGFHGFHIHDSGVCKAPSQDETGKTGAFLSAGGHFKRGTQAHGAHAGDMPPLFVRRGGRARATFAIDSFRVGQLTAGDGTAIMIHAGQDNLANIPDRYRSSASGKPGPDEETTKTGDAGDRVACGVVRSRRG